MQKLLIATIVVCLSVSTLPAQTANAIVGGTITDDSGTPLPAVMITATNARTNVVTNVTTNAEGSGWPWDSASLTSTPNIRARKSR